MSKSKSSVAQVPRHGLLLINFTHAEQLSKDSKIHQFLLLISKSPASISRKPVWWLQCAVGQDRCEDFIRRMLLRLPVGVKILQSLLSSLGLLAAEQVFTPRWSGSAKRWVHVPTDLLIKSCCQLQARQASKWCNHYPGIHSACGSCSGSSVFCTERRAHYVPLSVEGWSQSGISTKSQSSFPAWGSLLSNECFT